MPKATQFFDAQAKLLVKQAIEDSKLSKKELAALMKRDLGILVNDMQLANRINRGRFSLAFALQVLSALGRNSIPVPRLPTHLKPKPRVPG